MIIDARNLTPGANAQSGKLLPKMPQEEAKKLIRLSDQKKTDGEDAETLVMAPPESGKKSEPSAPRTDTLDLSLTGSRNLKETRIEYAFDMEYSKDTALTNAWTSSQNTRFRFLGSSGKVSDEAVVGMDKGEFAEYMKTHELDKEIDWFSVGLQTWGSWDYGSFSKFSDHVGALYASLENRITSDFAGEEQTEQLAKLNEVYEKAVNAAVEALVGRTERSFGDLGAALPEGKLEKSIRSVMKNKADAYRAYIAKNEDYAGIGDSGEKWLAQDVGFMTCALKKAYRPDGSAAGGELWSEKDILVLGMFGSMYSGAADENLQVIRANDEESLGFEISRRWLADRTVLSSFNPNGEVKSLCGRLFENYVESLLNSADKAIRTIGGRTVGTDPRQFAPLDRKAVYAVLDVMKTARAEGGDEKTALVKTAAFARSEFLKKAENSALWRYKNDFGTNAKKFWEGFYDARLGEPSAMKSVLTRWEKFESAVSSGEDCKIFKEIGFGLPE